MAAMGKSIGLQDLQTSNIVFKKNRAFYETHEVMKVDELIKWENENQIDERNDEESGEEDNTTSTQLFQQAQKRKQQVLQIQ